jgi:predicted metal-dependent hydrolase
MNRTYRDIEYTLSRSRRKTASIYIERDGAVSVLVPEKLSDRDIDRVIEAKRKWIYRNLAEWQDLNSRRVRRDYVNGEGFLYLGRSYRLKLVPDLDEPLMLRDGYFCLRANNGSIPDSHDVFKAFYREKGLVRIPPRVTYFQAKMGMEPKSIKVMDLKHRWASWTPGGNLNFHWKCMMAPLTILDYIVVHELAHLLYPNHTKAFWNEVDKLMPDFQERKDWLKMNGAGMDL